MHVNIPPQSRLAETKLRLVLSRSRISFVHGLVISICYLVFRWNESNIKCSLSYLLSNKMKINFDVLCPCMKHWISSEVTAPRLSHHSTGGRGWGISSSRRRDCIHIASAVPFANALYSASVDDHDTVGCFRELHDIKLGPKKRA